MIYSLANKICRFYIFIWKGLNIFVLSLSLSLSYEPLWKKVYAISFFKFFIFNFKVSWIYDLFAVSLLKWANQNMKNIK